MPPRKLRRVIIREEFVELTGNYKRAVILHQFDYWQGVEYERTGKIGWFRHSATEIAERTLMNLSPSNILLHVQALVDGGWVERREDPSDPTGRAKEYRLDLWKMTVDLAALGFPLEGWTFSKTEKAFSKTEKSFSEMKRGLSKTERPSYIENTKTLVDRDDNNFNAEELAAFREAGGKFRDEVD